MAPQRTGYSRRSFLKSSAGLAAGLAMFGWSNPWAYAQSDDPVALSIHIGLNNVHPGSYNGWNDTLRGPENDARLMAKFAKESGVFDPRNVATILGSRATNREVLRHIAWAAAILKPKDLLLITYSGHGGLTQSDPSGDEGAFGKDQTWCLFDGHLVDDILYHFWTRFADDVRIIVITDSCHSASSVKVGQAVAAAEANNLQLPGVPKGLKANNTIDILKSEQSFLAKVERSKSAPNPADLTAYSPVKGMPEFLIASVDQIQAADLRRWKEAYPKAVGQATSAQSTGAKGLNFAACADHTVAFDGSPNSVFTAAVSAVLTQGKKLDRSYDELFGAIRSDPRPVLFPFGQADAAFQREKAFTIG